MEENFQSELELLKRSQTNFLESSKLKPNNTVSQNHGESFTRTIIWNKARKEKDFNEVEAQGYTFFNNYFGKQNRETINYSGGLDNVKFTSKIEFGNSRPVNEMNEEVSVKIKHKIPVKDKVVSLFSKPEKTLLSPNFIEEKEKENNMNHDSTTKLLDSFNLDDSKYKSGILKYDSQDYYRTNYKTKATTTLKTTFTNEKKNPTKREKATTELVLPKVTKLQDDIDFLSVDAKEPLRKSETMKDKQVVTIDEEEEVSRKFNGKTIASLFTRLGTRRSSIRHSINKFNISLNELELLKTTSLENIRKELTKNEKLNDFIFSKDFGLNKLYDEQIKTMTTHDDRQIHKFNALFDSIDEEEMSEIDEEDIDSLLVLHFNKSFKLKYWSIVMFITIILSVLIQPFYLSFIKYSLIDKSQNFVIFLFMEIIFIIDILFSFLSPYENTNKHKKIFNQTFTTLNYTFGWLLFDIVTSLPLDIIYTMKGLNYDDSYFFFKWISILRVIKIFDKDHKMNFFEGLLKKFITDIETIRAAIFGIMFVIMVHVTCCMWISIGTSISDTNGWINVYEKNKGIYEIYLASFYFNLVTVLTVGYGDIIPHTFTEKAFIVVMLIFGIGTYSFLITALSSVFGKMDAQGSKKQEFQDILDSFDSEYGLGDDLFFKLREIINIVFKKNIVGFNDVLESLPFTVKTDLLLKMHSQNIKNLRFFNDKPRDFILYVLPLLSPCKFRKGDGLCSIEEILEETFIVTHGLLGVSLGSMHDNLEIFEIKKSKSFGEVLIYLNFQCPYEVYSKKDTEVLIMNKTNFLNTKAKFNGPILSILEENLRMMEAIEIRRKVYIELRNLTNNKETIIKAAEIIDLKVLKHNFDLFCEECEMKQESIIACYNQFINLRDLNYAVREAIRGNFSEFEIYQNLDKESFQKKAMLLDKLTNKVKKITSTFLEEENNEEEKESVEIFQDGKPVARKSIFNSFKANQNDLLNKINKTINLQAILEKEKRKRKPDNPNVNKMRHTTYKISNSELQLVTKGIINHALKINGYFNSYKGNKKVVGRKLNSLYSSDNWKNLVILFFDPLYHEISEFKEIERKNQAALLNESRLIFIKKIIKFDEKSSRRSNDFKSSTSTRKKVQFINENEKSNENNQEIGENEESSKRPDSVSSVNTRNDNLKHESSDSININSFKSDYESENHLTWKSCDTNSTIVVDINAVEEYDYHSFLKYIQDLRLFADVENMLNFVEISKIKGMNHRK